MKHNTVLPCVATEFLYSIKQNGELACLSLDKYLAIYIFSYFDLGPAFAQLL